MNKVRQGNQRIDYADLLEQAKQSGLLKSELPVDHAERVLALRADVSFGGLDQIIQSLLGEIGQSTSLFWSPGKTKPIPIPSISGRFSLHW